MNLRAELTVGRLVEWMAPPPIPGRLWHSHLLLARLLSSGRFELRSRAWGDVLGWKLRDLYGERLHTFVHHAGERAAERLLQWRNEEPLRVEFDLIARNNGKIIRRRFDWYGAFDDHDNGLTVMGTERPSLPDGGSPRHPFSREASGIPG